MKLFTHSKAHRLALPLLLAGSLIAAGCSGQTATPVQDLANTEVAQATEPLAATEPVAATDVPTEAATLEATTAPENTTAPETQQPAATAEGTSAAAVDTPGAGETAMPATDNLDELLVQSSNLIGMDIQAIEGVSLGTIRDVLVDEAGEVKYLVVEVPALAGGQAQNVIVDFSLLQTVVNDNNLEDVQLNFNGTPQDLANALPVELTEDLNAIISTTGTELPEELNNLVSLANVNALALQGSADEELGMLQDALIDLRQGQVDYVVLDLTTAAGAANSVMVPWERLNVDPTVAAETQAFVLDVTQDTLQNAPPVDLSTLPTFIDPNQVNWETLMDFWESLG
jgi:sporulation protein YlmC with PRC-barrel domain